MAPKRTPQQVDTPDLDIEVNGIPGDAAPVEKAAPSKRTSDKLDEEE